MTGCLLVAAALGTLLSRPWTSRRAAAGPILAWARDAALPVYIVHQTVGVACAYVVLRSGAPVGIALPAIVVATTAISVLVAEGLRRTPLRAGLGLSRGRTKGTGAPRPARPSLARAPVG